MLLLVLSGLVRPKIDCPEATSIQPERTDLLFMGRRSIFVSHAFAPFPFQSKLLQMFANVEEKEFSGPSPNHIISQKTHVISQKD